jgi:N-acetylmuramoyl-L-alanine amidase
VNNRVRELREANLGLHREAPEAAALAVLKAPDIPSVLFETGYINNPQDEAVLRSRAGQQSLADAAARAIRAFLARSAGM